MIKEFDMGFSEELTNEELKNKIYSIVEKLQGYSPIQAFQLINDYLKENIKALDYSEDDPAFSTAYAALVCKKANSQGFSKAFILILKELGILINENDFAKLEKRKYYKSDSFHSFYYVYIFYNHQNYHFSPYTEKICNATMIDHNHWFTNMTCQE